jgi:hypothetical protein
MERINGLDLDRSNLLGNWPVYGVRAHFFGQARVYGDIGYSLRCNAILADPVAWSPIVTESLGPI